jgi:hypothetical protein
MYEGGYAHGSEKGANVLQALPLGFTFFSVLIFAIPVVKAIDLAYNYDMLYWFGVVPLCAAALPVMFILVAHMVNRSRAGSTKIGVFVAIFGSGLALLLLGNRAGSYAGNLVSKLGASGCKSFAPSLALDEAYSTAKNFLQECKEATGTDNIVIQECEGYSEALQENTNTWHYLQHCEQQYQCAGWCEIASSPLWTLTSSSLDPCSVVIGQMMGERVRRMSSQLLGWSLGLISLASLVFAVLLPAFRKAGLDW